MVLGHFQAHALYVSNGSARLFFKINSENDKTVTIYRPLPSSSEFWNEDYTKHYDYAGALTIPSTIAYNGEIYTITEIEDDTFSACDKLTSIILPSSLKKIGSDVFPWSGSALLRRIDFSQCTSLEEIGKNIFSPYVAISEIDFSNTQLKIIPEGTFSQTAVQKVSLPPTLETIGVSAFHLCEKLTTINIPSSVKKIGKMAFYSCSSLSNIDFSNASSLEEIGESAFEGCNRILTLDFSATQLASVPSEGFGVPQITSIKLPNTVKTIGTDAFYNYNKLKTIIMPEQLRSIGSCAFYGCTSLNSVDFSKCSELTNINANAFKGCSLLRTFDFSKCYNLRTLGDYAFSDCSLLGTVNFANCNNLTILGSNVFSSTSISSLDLSNTSIEQLNSNSIGYASKLVDLKLPITLKRLETNALSRTQLNETLIPPSVSYIGQNALCGKTYITSEHLEIDLNQSGSIFFFTENLPSIKYTPEEYQFYTTCYVPDEQKWSDYLKTEAEKLGYTHLRIYPILYSEEEYEYVGTSQEIKVISNIESSIVKQTYNNVSAKNAGTFYEDCPLTLSVGEWNGSVSAKVKGEIYPALLQCKLTNTKKYYGYDLPEPTIEYVGFLGNDNVEAIDSVEFITECSKVSPLGKYSISANIKSMNYRTSVRSAIISVVAAPLMVCALDTCRAYGAENPPFEFKLEGLQLNETVEEVVVTPPNLSTVANLQSPTGEYSIDVTGGDFKNYEATQYVTGTMSVTKSVLKVKVQDVSRAYGSPNPTFSVVYEGFLNGDDEKVITIQPKFQTTATEVSPIGKYAITASGAESDNYEFVYEQGELTVAPSPLNVSVKDCRREYGDVNPRFEFVYSGFKNGDDESVISLLPTVTCSAKPNSPIGYYDIAISGGTAANYDLSYTPGILTVEKAPLTIRAKNATKLFGQPNPNFDLLYLGFKNNDDENCLIRLPKVITTASTESPVGEYPITASDAAAQNYTIEYEPGVLTVTRNCLTAKVKDSSREYGADNPQFVVEYSGFLNGDDESVITQKHQFRPEEDLTSYVGSYEVSAYGASSPNYDFQYEVGHIFITPKHISAKVGEYYRKYGYDNPEFEIEYIGLVNGDKADVITEPTVASCAADANSNVGDYPITLSGGRGSNYEVTSFTNGVLTVEKANQNIEWNQDLVNVQRYDQVELTAAASSGLPITYEVSSNNVVELYTSGNKTFIDCYGTGTVTIRATQKGNENYLASETVTNRITVVNEGGIIDPANPEIIINVTSAGTLSSKIAASKKYQIKTLTVSGPLNGTDIRYLREMSGRDVYGNKTNGILEKLDLSSATIVSGGNCYYMTGNSPSNREYYTSGNVISDYMFFGCSTLINLSLPNNSISIGANAFDGCLNLSQISMPSSIASIGACAFNGDLSLSRISIPEQTTYIGNYAFQNCTGLTNLVLSKSVKNIGSGILKGCPNIQDISLNDGNECFSTLDGVLYDKARESLIIFPAGKQLQTFEIPDGVIEIKNSGFYGVVALKYVFIPETLTTIGLDAFKGCSNLTKLFARPTTPPECLNECFEEVSKSNCTLYVPRWSGSAYWVAPVWADFVNIEAVNDLTVGGNTTKPDYCFEFTETTLSRGKQTYLPVSMNNVDPVVAFNFDVVLPEGIDIYKDASGNIQFKPTERVPMSQVFTAVKLSNGNIRVICNSTSNEPFVGTEGILFYLPLFITDTNASVDSEYILTLKDIEFSKKTPSGYTAVNAPDFSTILTVGQHTMGDANGDGRVTSLDAAMTRDYFLERNPSGFILKAADMNYDGKITGIDVVLVTDEFLAQNKVLSARYRTIEKYDGQLLIKQINDESTNNIRRFAITLPNAWRFTSVAMDIVIPDGFNLSDLMVGDGNLSSHVLRYYHHSDGLTRVIIYSNQNENLTSEDILTFDIIEDDLIHSSEMMTIDEIQAVEIIDSEYNELAIQGVNANLSEISGISDLFNGADLDIWCENAMLCIQSPTNTVITLTDMAGRSCSLEINEGVNRISLIPGIYIINNKKIIIK